MRRAIESTFDKEVTVMRPPLRTRDMGTRPVKIGTADCRIEYKQKLTTFTTGVDKSINQIIVFLFNDLGIKEGDSLILPDEDSAREIISVNNQTLPCCSDIYAEITL